METFYNIFLIIMTIITIGLMWGTTLDMVATMDMKARARARARIKDGIILLLLCCPC